jgi:hypothetical protein
MNTQKLAGTLGAAVAIVVLAFAFYSTSKSGADKPAPQKVSLPKGPIDTPPVRGPVIREIPQ